MYKRSGQSGGDCTVEQEREEVEQTGLERMALGGFILCSGGLEVLLAVERVLEGQADRR